MSKMTPATESAERAEVIAALERCQGPYAVRKAAKELGICERSLWRRIRKHGLHVVRYWEASETVGDKSIK